MKMHDQIDIHLCRCSVQSSSGLTKLFTQTSSGRTKLEQTKLTDK